MKIQLINGNEYAAITDERKRTTWKAGQRKAAKTGVNRRFRRAGRRELADAR
jgi:hypothetical protein